MNSKIVLNLKHLWSLYVSVSQSFNHTIIYGIKRGRRNGDLLENALSLTHANAIADTGGEKCG